MNDMVNAIQAPLLAVLVIPSFEKRLDSTSWFWCSGFSQALQ
jgi:hypothetical protein